MKKQSWILLVIVSFLAIRREEQHDLLADPVRWHPGNPADAPARLHPLDPPLLDADRGSESAFDPVGHGKSIPGGGKPAWILSGLNCRAGPRKDAIRLGGKLSQVQVKHSGGGDGLRENEPYRGQKSEQKEPKSSVHA